MENVINNIIEELVSYDIFKEDIITEEMSKDYFDDLTKRIPSLLWLLEAKLNIVHQNKSVLHGFEDKYQFKVGDFSYYSSIIYFDKSYIIDIISNNILKAITENSPDNHIDSLENIKNTLENSKKNKVMFMQFETEDLVKKLTNKVKNLAYEVISSAHTSFIESMKNKGGLKDIAMIYFLINKQELKRLRIYKRLLNSVFGTNFLDTYSDIYSDNNNIKIYAWSGDKTVTIKEELSILDKEINKGK